MKGALNRGGTCSDGGRAGRWWDIFCHSGKTTKISQDLKFTICAKFLACLRKNADIFAWSSVELEGIRAHRLEKEKVIEEKVIQLLKVGHVREVHFPTWISNVVLVSKSVGQWKTCVDFRDLNKSFPMIDTSCPELIKYGFYLRVWALLFHGCLSGLPPDPLAQEDQDKVNFIILGGTFCYMVMPFILENVGATYQILMDKIQKITWEKHWGLRGWYLNQIPRDIFLHHESQGYILNF